jgi:hypothetical protein
MWLKRLCLCKASAALTPSAVDEQVDKVKIIFRDVPMVTEVKSVVTEKLKKKRKNEEITRVDKILLYECDCEIFQFGRF